MESNSNTLVMHHQVAFSETDASGLIHFTTYFTMMELAEAELFQQLGIPLIKQENGQLTGYPRVDCQCTFKRPVGFGDSVEIELCITQIQPSRIHYTFSFKGPNGRQCAEGSMVTAFALRNLEGKIEGNPIPDDYRNALEAWKNL